MVSLETRTTRLAFFGRLADEVTRRPLFPQDMTVTLEETQGQALLKHDGHFAFTDLAPSANDYHIRLGGPAYQKRTVAKTLPTPTPVQVSYPGEDELYVTIANLTLPNRVTFEEMPFVPKIEAGAAVIGQGGFTATLAEALEGQKVSFAELSTTAGLAGGQLLRIVRSNSLLMRPGPYYPFSGDTTVLVLKVAWNDATEPPIDGATLSISQVNANAPAVVNVGGLSLRQFDLGGVPQTFLVLDPDDVATLTNDRGDAAFAFPGGKAIATIRVSASHPNYVTANATIAVSSNARTFHKFLLNKV